MRLVRIEDATASASAVNFRPDFWLFPFLNIYGILALQIHPLRLMQGYGCLMPIAPGHRFLHFRQLLNLMRPNFWIGFTPTFGVAGAWVALDMNVAWSDVSALDKPVFTFVFGPRVGKTFKFKNPDMNIAGWVGGFRLQYSSETNGSYGFKRVDRNR
jgi:hypothetical protein